MGQESGGFKVVSKLYYLTQVVVLWVLTSFYLLSFMHFEDETLKIHWQQQNVQILQFVSSQVSITALPSALLSFPSAPKLAVH